MGNTIYTATGCSRCKIAKKFMDEHAIPFQELDIKAEGKDAFGQFYRNNRSAVFRGKEGIEFPIFTDDADHSAGSRRGLRLSSCRNEAGWLYRAQ